jgi:hypothetical protein
LGAIRSTADIPQSVIDEALYAWEDYDWHPPLVFDDTKHSCEITEEDIVRIADEKTYVLCR